MDAARNRWTGERGERNLVLRYGWLDAAYGGISGEIGYDRVKDGDRFYENGLAAHRESGFTLARPSLSLRSARRSSAILPAALLLTIQTPKIPAASPADRRAILAAVGRAAFRRPERHRLVATTLASDGRFAFAEIRRADDKKYPEDVRRFFDPESDHGGDIEFFLRNSDGRWRILYWMGYATEGAAEGEGFVFDYRPLRPTGFPARLAPRVLRRTWAHKWVFKAKGTETTVVADVATLDRHWTSDRFALDGYTVERRGLYRP